MKSHRRARAGLRSRLLVGCLAPLLVHICVGLRNPDLAEVLYRRLEPWADLVEVHWSAGAEAYVTPVGARSVNLALLWEADAFEEKASFESLLAHFPALRERLGGAPVESEARGAGPLSRPREGACEP